MSFQKGNKNWKLRKKEMIGGKNPQWAGDNVGYSGVHLWIKKRKLKPKVCENCKINKPLEIANISGKYKRDINDFEFLCRKCHMIKDGRYIIAINNLKSANKIRGDNGRYVKARKHSFMH